MQRLNGREAVSVLAEVKAGKRELDDKELRYVKTQVSNFVVWLAEKAKITVTESSERVKRIIASEIKLLLADDPFADFIWSRGDEVGDLEISISGSLDADFEKSSDDAHFSEQEYWNHMERVAERNVGKYPDEVWAHSREKMELIMENLQSVQHSGKLLRDEKVMKYLRKCNKRINDLRFGKKPELMNKHWKLCKNLVNELLGYPKRYEIKEAMEKTEEEKIDALDDNGLEPVLDTMDAVYGFDLTRLQDEAQAEVFEE